MEKSKKIDITKRPKEVKNDTWTPSCPIWFLGNEKSANNDLQKKFEIVDE
jgi:hypothetical protein